MLARDFCWVFLIAAALFAGPAAAKDAGVIRGKAFVVDGNVISIHGRKLRLFGMDAPDRGQTCASAGGAAYPCGIRAANALDNMVRGKIVQCEPRGVGADMLLLATCSLSGLDLASAMIESGWATANSFAPQYAETEGAAKAAKIGIWSGAFQEPAEWRRTHAPPKSF